MTTRALIIRGNQGTGKTTLGEALSRQADTCLLSKDDIYLPALAETREHHSASRIAYAAIRSTLVANRHSGILFAIDAPFHENQDVADFAALCQEHDIVAKSVLLVCDDYAIWDKRLRARADSQTPNHKINTLNELQAARESLVPVPMTEELVLDTTSPGHTPSHLANLCLAYVNSPAPRGSE